MMPTPLPLLDAALRGGSAVLALLLAALLARSRPPETAPRVAIALLLGLAVQTLAGSPTLESSLPRGLLAPLVGVAVGNAVLFWWLAQTLFDDETRGGPLPLTAWLAAVGLGTANVSLGCVQRADPWSVASVAAQRLLPLVCVAGAMLAAARHWRGDLVEQRRRLRPLIIGAGAAYTLIQFGLRLGQPGGRLSGVWALLDTTLVLALLALIAWPLLGVSETAAWFSRATPAPEPGASAPAAAPAAPDLQDERLAERLHRAMTIDRLYRGEDLSIGSLADQLGVPEYRLRRLIRQRLGHRHFAGFINSHRLADALAALADPQQRGLPVLTIALNAGFQSIGPFNRAFKAATGLTPTEFRRQKQADS